MTIDFWGLGLQAVNVLILVWLLSWVFWRPVARAITKRQDVVQTTLTDAKIAQDKADAALAEITEMRAGMAAEREALLAEATTKAEIAAKTALDVASEKAEKIVDAARISSQREADITRHENAEKSAKLAVNIARKLLERFDTVAVQAAFLELLIEAIGKMPAKDRAALDASTASIELISALDLKGPYKTRIMKAIYQALGSEMKLTFVTDPDLIAGLELRTAHFVLHNSWRSDLAIILKDLNDAA